ncbi:MAG: glycosyltransferase, partial [Bacteroidota bacterium]
MGPDTEKLEKLLLEFKNGKHFYAGYKRPSEIWSENHALVLTSHYEGLPIVIIEAGLFGRTCVVTNVSGNAELISENVDGFSAHTDSQEAIDEALERAWSKRFEWQQMGDLLRRKLLNIIPDQPGKILADIIL